MSFTGFPALQRSANFFAASAALRPCFTRDPSVDSSVFPVSRNSIQFSSRSLAKTNTTRSKCSFVTPCRSASLWNAVLSASPSAQLSSQSPHTISVVSAPAVRQLCNSTGILSISAFLPPHGTMRIALLPLEGRSQLGSKRLINLLMNTSSMLLPFSPSQRQTICVLLATNPPPCDRLTHSHAFGHLKWPDPSRRRMVITPQVAPILLARVRKDLRMV